VGFRWFVRQQARTLGVRGWVRNHADGSVEVEAEGDPSVLAQLRSTLAKGPPGAHVTSVDDVAGRGAEPPALPDPFAILR
jgi:acylphosphatase